VDGPDSYTPFGYSNGLRHVLANVLGSRRSAATNDVPGSETSDAEAHVEVRTTVIEPVEAYLYRPAKAAWLWLADVAKRLQSGRLDAYVTYMLVALLVLLAIVAAMK
jgi:hypothetical protein